MSRITDEQRRIAQTQQALRRLASGAEYRRGELFDKKNGKYENWPNRVLNKLVELGVIEAHGESFARYYKIAPATRRSELIDQANDVQKISMLLWPREAPPMAAPEEPPEAPTKKLSFIEMLKSKKLAQFADVTNDADADDAVDDDAIDDFDDADDTDDEPTLTEAVTIILQLMGGIVEKLDRIERAQTECLEILQEFKS